MDKRDENGHETIRTTARKGAPTTALWKFGAAARWRPSLGKFIAAALLEACKHEFLDIFPSVVSGMLLGRSRARFWPVENHNQNDE